jgi:hypothetical protein
MDSGGTNVWQFIASVVVAVVFSDVAAVITTLIYQRWQSKQARLTALRSLLNEVERIEKIAAHNSGLSPAHFAQPVTKMPVAAFETAFVCGKPTVGGGSELLKAVTDYLACADFINSLVDIHVAGATIGEGAGGHRVTQSVRQIVEYCRGDLPGILGNLERLLQHELDKASGKRKRSSVWRLHPH